MISFEILMGIPAMQVYWEKLCMKAETNTLGNETKLFKKLVKALNFLRENPKHRSLRTHEIRPLSKRYGIKIWQSDIENRTPSAGRFFWVYGPNKKQITIVGIETHPENTKRDGYHKVRLSNMPNPDKPGAK